MNLGCFRSGRLKALRRARITKSSHRGLGGRGLGSKAFFPIVKGSLRIALPFQLFTSLCLRQEKKGVKGVF